MSEIEKFWKSETAQPVLNLWVLLPIYLNKQKSEKYKNKSIVKFQTWREILSRVPNWKQRVVSVESFTVCHNINAKCSNFCEIHKIYKNKNGEMIINITGNILN